MILNHVSHLIMSEQSSNGSADSGHTTSRTRTVSRRRTLKLLGSSGIAASLAGCSGGDGGGDGGGGDGGDGANTQSGSGGVTITWMTWPKGDVEAFNEALHDAGMPERITVEIQPGGQTTTEFRNKEQQLLNAGRNTPDILDMDSAWILPFIQRGQLVNLSEKLPDSVLSDVENRYFPQLQHVFGRENLDPDGDLYAIPRLSDFPEIQYRRDLVDEAGYDPDSNDWATEGMSWKRLSNVAADVADQTGTKHGFVTRLSASGLVASCFFQEVIAGWDGAYFGDQTFGEIGNRPITVDEEPVLESLRMLRTFIYGSNDEHAFASDRGYAGGFMPKSVLQMSIEPARKTFHAGDAAFMRNWPYSIPIERGKWGDRLGLMPDPWAVPKAEATNADRPKQTLAALGGWNNGINPNTEHMDEVIEFMIAMNEPEPHMVLFENAGILPPRKDYLEMIGENPDRFPELGGYIDTLTVASESAVPYPQSQVWTQEADKITQQVHAVLKQEKSPEQGMGDLKSQLEQLENSV